MQDLDNNMDELFRKAGEGYPLKTDADGWDTISPMLSEPPALSHIPIKKGNLKKYSILLILLMTFFLFDTLTSRYIWNEDSDVAGRLVNTKLPLNDAAAKSPQTNSATSQRLVTQTKVGNSRKVINKRGTVAITFTIPDANEVLSTEVSVGLDAESNAAVSQITLQPQRVQKVTSSNTEKSEWQDVDVLQKNNDVVTDKLPVSLLKAAVDKIPVNTNDTTLNKQVKNVKSNPLRSRFYVGVLAGFSINQVKSQGFQKPGFDVGFKAGYQFTKQFSIETGLLFEQKYYYTSGEYFNIAKIASAMPVGLKVLSLEGKLSVCELPLTFKYNLPGNRKDRHFYTTAGISTYLISKEYNQYQTLLNGTQNGMTGTYRNQSLYSAALLNISIGYEKNIGRSTVLRVDPYIQFPIKGLGVGAIPVTTIGVRLGVFRFTHQQ